MYLFYDAATKQALFTMSSEDPEILQAQTNPWVLVPDDVVDLHDWVVEAGTAARKSTVPLCPDMTLPASYDLTLLPAGSVVTVSNEANESLVISLLVGSLTFTDTGSYTVSVQAPHPFLGYSRSVRISNA